MSDQTTTSARNLRATLIGRVTSDKTSKTITVKVERTYKHPKYNKYVRRDKRYHAHDEDEVAGTGDLVEIMATRPISKLKRWRLVRVVEAAPDRGVDLTRDENLPGSPEETSAGGVA